MKLDQRQHCFCVQCTYHGKEKGTHSFFQSVHLGHCTMFKALKPVGKRLFLTLPAIQGLWKIQHALENILVTMPLLRGCPDLWDSEGKASALFPLGTPSGEPDLRKCWRWIWLLVPRCILHHSVLLSRGDRGHGLPLLLERPQMQIVGNGWVMLWREAVANLSSQATFHLDCN